MRVCVHEYERVGSPCARTVLHEAGSVKTLSSKSVLKPKSKLWPKVPTSPTGTHLHDSTQSTAIGRARNTRDGERVRQRREVVKWRRCWWHYARVGVAVRVDTLHQGVVLLRLVAPHVHLRLEADGEGGDVGGELGGGGTDAVLRCGGGRAVEGAGKGAGKGASEWPRASRTRDNSRNLPHGTAPLPRRPPAPAVRVGLGARVRTRQRGTGSTWRHPG